MHSSPNSTLSNQQLARRSKRKTKKIDRDQFAHTYTKNSKQKRKCITQSKTVEQSQVQNYCAKLISINSQKHQQYLLSQMSKALLHQKQKLFLLLQIKLQESQPLQQPIQIQETPMEPSQILQEEVQDLSDEIAQKESESLPIWEVRHLKKAESAKMLCDNYENNELIYSFETLTPRLNREDLQFRFIEDLQ